ncbi:MAG: 16S rRNA (cytosine(1402)-N(4))-methyltransferase RsmH [Candidatus Peribacteraceae bacterium]|nr:16S rRNA (cytosine(1402)-N(4))-methyltransferase RsmH [Candidatus Peribacteraceae bacterium]
MLHENSDHIPVLLITVLDTLKIKSGDSILDCTLGLGGHSKAMIEAAGESGTLTALDADLRNMAVAKERLAAFSSRIRFIHTNFLHLPDCLGAEQATFDVIFADLGLSSPHIDLADRGFTFRSNAPLDMRYDHTQGFTAADVLMKYNEEDLRLVFQNYGELPKTHRFVTAILEAREEKPLRTADDLNAIIDTLYNRDAKKVTAQIYQALRIEVNSEMLAVEQLLSVGPKLLKPGGRMAILTYHSLEDRLVKQAFKALCTPEKDDYTGAVKVPANFSLLTRHAIKPTDEEIENNPRARSAHLRAILRL